MDAMAGSQLLPLQGEGGVGVTTDRNTGLPEDRNTERPHSPSLCPIADGEELSASPASGSAGSGPQRRLPTYASTIMLGTGVKGRGRTMRNLPVDPEDLKLLAERGEAWAVCELRRVNRQQKRAAAKAAREARRKEEAANAKAAAQPTAPAHSPSPGPSDHPLPQEEELAATAIR